jgi:hypothetical protein
MKLIRLAAASLALCALIGLCSATSFTKVKFEYSKLVFIRDSAPEKDEKREAFWKEFEIYGRLVLASEVAKQFELPLDAIPVEHDSVMLVGYYVLPDKPPFGYFDFHFDMIVDEVGFDLGGVTFEGMTFSPKRVPYCKLIRPAPGLGQPLPMSELRTLLDKTPKLKLRRAFTK